MLARAITRLVHDLPFIGFVLPWLHPSPTRAIEPCGLAVGISGVREQMALYLFSNCLDGSPQGSSTKVKADAVPALWLSLHVKILFDAMEELLGVL